MRNLTDASDHPNALTPVKVTALQWWVIAFILIVPGLGIRIWRVFFANLPLRVDEIRVAWNLFDRNWAQLTQPLDHHQAAPLGFLWLVDSVVSLLGRDEWVLRLIPLLAGCALLFVLAQIARQTLNAYAAWAVVLLASLNATFIMHATDLKQYSVDALAAAILLWAVLPALKPEATTRSRIVLGIVGSAALLMSHGAFFITAGLGLSLMAFALAKRNRKAAIQLLGIASAWIIVLALLYWFNLRFTAGRDDLMKYWARDFAPNPFSENAWVWYKEVLRRLAYTSGFAWPVQLIVGWLLLVGVFTAVIKQPRLLAVMAMPFFLVLAAAMAKQYPFSGRMIVFLVPACLLLMGMGIEHLVQRVSRIGHILILLAIFFVILTSLKLGRINDNAAVDPLLNWIDSQHRLAHQALFIIITLCALGGAIPWHRFKRKRSIHAEASPHSSPRNTWGFVMGAAIVTWAIGVTLPTSQLTKPWVGGRYNIDKPFTAVADQREVGDGIIVEKRLYYPFKHYAADYGFAPDTPLLHLPYFEGDPRGQAMYDEAMKHQRVWILASVSTRTGRGQSVNTQDLLFPLLHEFGPPIQVIQTGSVIAWLFDRKPLPEHATLQP